MIIIYYKGKHTGEYKRVYEAAHNKTLEELAPLIAEYNASPDHQETVGAVEVADNSLEAYLFNTRNLRANVDKEAIRDAIEALEEALHNVRFLEG